MCLRVSTFYPDGCFNSHAEANKHDFRGYYGLGQTYEILKMPHFALYYYKQAHRLR